ncbi:MAG: UvrD-helicase domain-containing protein [Veillonella sp.]|uniref:UvrD-helicase domain-containing protein n=1 Tax=Veillonella caviae TaxID=248316 RepID=UPI000F8F63CD|nr:UvrD-helicase domain-containing protein [Veillonella caviae]MCF0157473.1 UvrD-helicase domain-containing protein [Veillonella sp.]
MENKFVVTTNWIGKLLGYSYELVLDDNLITIVKNKSADRLIDYSLILEPPKLEEYLWGNKVSIIIDGQIITFPFLNKSLSVTFYSRLKDICQNNNECYIRKLSNRYYELTENEFLRDSNIDEVKSLINETKIFRDKYKDTILSAINEDTVEQINFITNQYPLTNAKIADIRKSYEDLQLEKRANFFDTVEKNPLTENQRLSVIRNNDINLVLAAAGTGKTSVMVAKILDLMDSNRVAASEILAIAYNKSAAVGVKTRLKDRMVSAGLHLKGEPRISTFHALGLNIIKDCGRDVSVSRMATDDKVLIQWFKSWLKEYLLENQENLHNFIKLLYQPIDSFTFKSKQEYDSYVRDNEYRTINGELVKGYQELLIANWLTMHKIPYKYEAKYTPKRRIEIGFDYSPDFDLGNGIYLEHFGISRNGNTRADIDSDEYNENIKRKRDLHKEYGTILLETYHYEWTENRLEKKLERLMHEVGLEIKEMTGDELLTCLNNSGLFDDAGNRYVKCLQAIRVERLSESEVLERLNSAKIIYAKEYTKFLMAIHDAYVKKLHNENEIDFDDMIIIATDLVESGEYKPRWKHILVDEFQDISMARLQLLLAIYEHGPKPIWTVVGDDWQSIYRFNGGKLEITTQFNKRIGSHTLSILDKTYRYNNSIADTAGTFIMENPEQYEKAIITNEQVNESCIFIYDTYVTDGQKILDTINSSEHNKEKYVLKKKNEDKDRIEITGSSLRAYKIIKKIKEKNPNAKIAILSRYNYILKNAKYIIKDKSVKFWTFHASKGLEADYCILLGFFRGKVGFPNENHDDAVLEALLPTLDGYPHSEERRLFYVALTRAKKESHIVVNSDEPSVFIEELLTSKYHINIESERLNKKIRTIYKCNQCSNGYYVLNEGKYGKFYKCTSGISCPSRPRVCEKCGAPSIDYKTKSICQNPACGYSIEICERCGRPMELKEGKYGKFWGCSGYGIPYDSCTNTRPIQKK